MDGILDIYHGALDAYRLVAPWIPLQFNASVQSLVAQSWTILHTLLTNPTDLRTMIPTIISTVLLFWSVYWTLSTMYYTVQRGFRWLLFLLKYGSIFAVFLGAVGWVNLGTPKEDVTVAEAVITGLHTVADFVGFDTFVAPPPSSPSGPGKPWEKFIKSDGPSSNTRSKKATSSSRRKSHAGRASAGDLNMADALSWFNKLREDFWSGGDEETMGGSAFEREILKIWENNKDGWRSADDFLNAFKLKTPQAESGGARASEGGESRPYSEGTESR